MINFLHFSDFHIQKRRSDLKFGVDPCLGLERAIKAAREMDVNPAFSIVTGDISQDGSEEGYLIAKEYFQENLQSVISNIMSSKAVRKNMSANGMAAIDGKGALRVSEVIMSNVRN